MSLLDTILSSPALPKPNEHAPSFACVTLMSAVAEQLRVAGRLDVTWDVGGRAWSLTLEDEGRVSVWVDDDRLTWIPADELCLAVRSEDKLGAIDAAVAALGELTR